MSDYSICPIINGLSDHDAQSILIRSFNLRPPPKKYRFIRRINEYTLQDFLINLSYGNWDTLLSTDDVNMMFNSLDTYIKIANTSFPLKRVSIPKANTKKLITSGILTSCKRKKRELFIASRISNNLNFIAYYRRYCKILCVVIKEAKKLDYAKKNLKIFEQKQNCLGYSKLRNK